MPPKANPAHTPDATARARAALQSLEAQAGAAGQASPDGPAALTGPAARAQRLMARAMYDALLSPDCECTPCRALRKVARLTRDATDEDLEDADD